MFQRLFDSLRWRYRRHQDHAFDKRYGLDTGQGELSYLQTVMSDNAKFAVPYEPVQVFMFRRMLRDLSIEYADYVFLDLGSGKGRALLLAAQYEFAKIIGVEFSEQLHKIAEKNVASYRYKNAYENRIELVCQDAATFEFPQQDLVLFLYNPFFGPAMQAVADKVSQFVSKELHDFVLFYRNPQCSDLFDSVQGLCLVQSTGSYRIYRKRQKAY